jgi:hypothetical protein
MHNLGKRLMKGQNQNDNIVFFLISQKLSENLEFSHDLIKREMKAKVGRLIDKIGDASAKVMNSWP